VGRVGGDAPPEVAQGGARVACSLGLAAGRALFEGPSPAGPHALFGVVPGAILVPEEEGAALGLEGHVFILADFGLEGGGGHQPLAVVVPVGLEHLEERRVAGVVDDPRDLEGAVDLCVVTDREGGREVGAGLVRSGLTVARDREQLI